MNKRARERYERVGEEREIEESERRIVEGKSEKESQREGKKRER